MNHGILIPAVLVGAFATVCDLLPPWVGETAGSALAVMRWSIVADCTLEGNPSADTGRPIEAHELSSKSVDAIMDELAANYSPSLADEIRAALDEGRVSIGIIPPSEGSVYGTHDWNTIGLSPYHLDPAIAAIAVMHEWWHVEKCGGGPPSGGSTNDPSTGTANDPCGPVGHMSTTSNSACQACQRLASAGPALQDKLCKMVRDLIDAMVAQANKAAAAGCPSDQIPDPTSLVPVECIDFCDN